MQIHRKHRYLLSILTGVLLSAAFPYIGSVPPIAFFALVPLLILEEHIFSKKLKARKLFFHVYLTFVIYNALTCWWVYYASAGGVIMAIFANSVLMLFPWMLFHWTKKYVGVKEGYIGLPFFWLAFEYFHYHWELSWPWLTFGNMFSIVPSWVQWYEYTGVLGGSLWILLANLLIFQILKNVWGRKQAWQAQRKLIIFLGVLIFIPILISILLLNVRQFDTKTMKVVVVQPNIDPYNEKFNTPPKQQILKINDLANAELKPSVDFVVAPETAMPMSILEQKLLHDPEKKDLQKILAQTDSAAWVIGASTHKVFKEKNSEASKPMKNGGFYESYNTALLFDKEGVDVQVYHKSKLVLGVEHLPFAWLLKPIESWAIDLGGTSGSLGVEKEPKLFSHNGFNVIPAICYESVYGGYLASFSNKGAVDALFVITNDGWWKDTPGYKQHFSFSRLRAIEMRKPVVRSANTGWSGIIDPYGNDVKKTNWWEPDVFYYEVETNRAVTFYMVYGDIIGRSSAWVAALMIVLIIARFLRRFGTKTPFGGRK